MQELIVDFMNNFYGYGNLKGKYWFIGMEEGCGPDWETDVVPRFEVWRNRGKRQVEDLREYHFAIGITHHWVEPVNIQFTWRRLIQTVLAAEGKVEITLNNERRSIARHHIAAYQSQYLGNSHGNDCLLELLPIPSPNIGEFAYTYLATEQFPFFADRTQYESHVRDMRIHRIQELIRDNKPPHVVLYGRTHMAAWKRLVGETEWTPMNQWIECCRVGETCYWIVPHPNAFGLPGDLFISLGEMMREGTCAA